MDEPAGAATTFVLGGGLPLVLARATFVGALLSIGGVLVFRAVVLPPVRARVSASVLSEADRRLMRLFWVALALAFVADAAWTILQAADLAGATRLADTLAALRPVLLSTRFGHLVLLQAALLCVTAVMVLGSAVRSAATVAIVDVGTQAAHGHAMAMVDPLGPLFWVDTLHLLAASAWIGGLPPLLIVIRHAPFKAGALAARWFSPLGKWCVVILVVSAVIQSWRLVGTFRALVETPYGRVVLVKSSCFGVLLGLAALNRYRLAPALVGVRPELARRRLVRSIAVQTLTGVLAVIAAGVLSGLTPGMDLGTRS